MRTCDDQGIGIDKNKKKSLLLVLEIVERHKVSQVSIEFKYRIEFKVY